MLSITSLKKSLPKEAELLIVTLGIYISYIYFGVLQEHMYFLLSYTNPSRDPFYFSEFIVFCQLVLGFAVSSLRTS